MKTTTIWYKPELELMRNEFFNCTLLQLLERINQLRTEPVTYQEMRHQLIRMGLKKMIQIRWSKEDIDFLYENYRTIGDLELSKLLTARKSTFRVINGEKVYRTFTKKHVDKKRQLLGLFRSTAEIKAILQRNIKNGRHVWTKQNNAYTQGIKTLAAEGTIRLWRTEGNSHYVIKINKRYVFLSRHLWEQKHGAIPNGMVIRAKDGNPLNCDIDNWEMVNRNEHLEKNTGCEALSDKYIVDKLTYRNDILKKQLRQMPELIELKRSQIKLNRTVNELIKTTEDC
jgi:hypothetical protein